jgi:cyclic beta-1,2-glucan synthetase
VAVLNRLVSEWVRPAALPRLRLDGGIPPAQRVLVVVPAMLDDAEGTAGLIHRLHLHHLANPEPEAQFALLTDLPDAPGEHAPGDERRLAEALAGIATLNARHPAAPGQAPRFIVLHRARQPSATEDAWIGWERKRGKLLQLLGALSGAGSPPFADLGEASRVMPGVRHVLTLDSDTRLPPGRLRLLLGVAAHPLNRPRLGADGRRVVAGYGILQPRVVTPLPAAGTLTAFHWLFAGQPGIDPYSAASSEVYQDLFGEGSFSGKGLLDVAAMQAVLGGRLPPERVLSHDLIEGAIARCAAVTDVELLEDAPFRPGVAAARIHRWTRGDW